MPFGDYNSNIFQIPAEVQCLCSVIKNKTTKEVWFLLPWHGTTLGPNEQYVVVGDINTWYQRKRYRTRDAFLKAILNDVIEVVSLPNPHVTNGTVTKMLTLDATGTAVSVTNPCWV